MNRFSDAEKCEYDNSIWLNEFNNPQALLQDMITVVTFLGNLRSADRGVFKDNERTQHEPLIFGLPSSLKDL